VEGMGIIMVPSFIAYKEIESGALVQILNDYIPPKIEAYAIYPQTRHLSQRVRAFVDFLVNRFSGTPYWDLCLDDN
jgi:DNA-binding transcriptional LysR family regulator